MVAFVVVFILLNLILWLFFYFKFKKTYSPKKVLENIASEVDKLLIEINNTTDRGHVAAENTTGTGHNGNLSSQIGFQYILFHYKSLPHLGYLKYYTFIPQK